MGCRGGGSTSWCVASARCRRRCAPAGRRRVRLLWSRGAGTDRAPDQRVRARGGAGVRSRRSCSASAARHSAPTRCVTALRPPAWNELDERPGEYFPRLTRARQRRSTSVALPLCRRIDLPARAGQRVSKSGGTAETLAQYLVVRHWLEEALGPSAPAVISSSPPTRRRAPCRRARRCGRASPTLEVPAGRGRPVQRALAGGAPPRGAGRHRHRGAACEGAAAPWPAGRTRRTARQPGRAVRGAALDSPTRRPAPGSTC